ncbi:MAG: hypothetical protein CHACPFDD_03926 [Phycisphaerae bacterium]|nr:hypothetical protein [Phycisphaerae bacterium]
MRRVIGAAAQPAHSRHKSGPNGSRRARGLPLMMAAALLAGCEPQTSIPPMSMSQYRAEILERQATAAEAVSRSEGEAAGEQPVASSPSGQERAALLTGEITTSMPAGPELFGQVPDPTEIAQLRARTAELMADVRDERARATSERVMEHAAQLLGQLPLPKKRELSLRECIRRALQNNYDIRIASHDPAVSQTEVVRAEAAFDSVFFLDWSWNETDAAVPDDSPRAVGDTRQFSGGFRQLLATGAEVTTALGTNRQVSSWETKAAQPILDPSYTTDLTLTLRQPLLRGFGLDVNRAQININKASYGIAREQFLQQVNQTLFDVESAYWRLVQARRNVAIQAISVSQNLATYESLKQRHDATQIEINNSRSRYLGRVVTYQETVKNVREAEDALKNLLNDPELPLSEHIELILSDAPVMSPLVVDHFAEVRSAIDHRHEIAQSRLAIERARVQTTVAKNQTLPQLDLAFTYNVSGIDDALHGSFTDMTSNRFLSYAVSATFSYPLGNRAPRAAHRGAQLQESAAVIALQRVTDLVVQEVNTAVRTLSVRFSQIPTQYDSVVAAERNLRALQARAQRVDPAFLNTELDGVEQLANARARLLQVIIDYNIAIAGLEQSKGTLLEFNNVVLSDVSPGH